MLFDKILEFLLRSRLGNLVLVGGIIASSFLFGGCLVPDLCSCANEEAGCRELASCWSNCDDKCNDCGNSCGGEDCALNGCLYGDGCITGCGDCVTDCGGCNRTIFTESDCSGGCSGDSCSSSCLNCTTSCDGSLSIFEHTIQLIYKDQFGETIGESHVTFEKRVKVDHIQPYDQNGAFYTFEGYYTDEAMNNQCTDNAGNWLGEDNVNSLDVLYGKLTELYVGDSRTLRFSFRPEFSEYSIGDVNLTVGGNITNFAVPPTIPGYTFRHWLLATGKTRETIDLNERFHLKDWCLPEDVGNPIIEVIAVYEPQKIELDVYFDSGEPIPMEFDYDTTLKKVVAELRLSSYGHLFDNTQRKLVGWSREEGATWRDSLLPEDERFKENSSIYAVYKNYVTVYFHNTEGPDKGLLTERCLEGDAVTLPDLKPSGPYYFDGWYNNSGFTSGVSGQYVVGSEDAHLYAKWHTQTTYQITYHIDATNYWSRYYSMSDQPQKLDDASEKVGYNFEGWCRTATLEDDPMKQLPPNTYGDLDLYAKYTPNTYSVHLTAGMGATVKPNEQNVTYGTRYRLPVPYRENYDFEGWFLGDKQITDSQGNSLSEFTEDALGIKLTNSYIQLVARWSEHQYLIQFMVEGESQPYVSVKRKSGETIGPIPELQTNPVKRGHEFEGWYCGEERFDPAYRVTGDRTYTARFSTKVYTVRLNAEGGSLTVHTVQITFGAVTTLPVPTWKDGTKTFLGWFDGEGNQLTFEDGILISPFDYDDPNLELHARWA